MAPSRKSKPKDPDIGSAQAKDGLSRIEHKQQLPEELLCKVHRLLLPCPPACGTKGTKGSKDNPQCFCGLVPPEGSYRKKGLWHKEPLLDALGRDPAEDRRQGPAVPAGLRNLGQTCYVNAAMQFLFATPDFSHALINLEPEIAQQDIVRQLRELCIDHCYGPRNYADPAPFVTALQLNTAVQQDGQEFLKLLLQKLEHIFAASQQQEVVSVVQRLFRGYFSYVTTCRNCQRASEGSKRVTEYYELPVQVVGMKSLQESLSCALACEELVGENQYHCDLCGKKCDAERQMRLRSLPPYLCLSLQRFVFDFQTLDKKKATDKLSIPLLLDMGQVIAATGVTLPEGAPTSPDGTQVLAEADCAQYELAAVLIHRGTSASHGHYVAHVKMPDTGIWWRFDDEVAEEMGPNPTKFPPMDHGTTAVAAAGEDGKATAGKAKGSGGRGKRAKKDDNEDDDYEVAIASKKSRGAGFTRGRGSGKGRGRGRRGKSPGKSADNGVDVMDEDSQLQEALRASRQAEVQEQETAWASIRQQQLNRQSVQQQREEEQRTDVDIDEGVTPTESTNTNSSRQHKAAAGSDTGTITAKQAARERLMTEAGDKEAATDSQQAAEQGELVSGNAYFVVYRQRNSRVASAAAARMGVSADSAAADVSSSSSVAAAANSAEMLRSTFVNVQLAASPASEGVDEVKVQLHPQLLQPLQRLPESVHQQVVQLHRQFEQACRNHTQMKQDAVARVGQRQQEVRSVHQLLQCPEDAVDSGRFLPASWLEAWANSNETPGPIDNGQLMCEHNGLKLDKPGLMKYVSKAAWDALVAEHRGGPELGVADTCRTCLAAHLKSLVRSDHLQLLREELLDCLAIDEHQQQNAATGVGYYVSKSWLAGFKRRDRIGGGSLQPPTAGITCCHALLAPEALSVAAKRVLVSADSWGKLQELWVTQVMRELAARRDKAAKAAAARVLAAPHAEDTGTVSDDDEVEVIDRTAADEGLPNGHAVVQPQQLHAEGVEQQGVDDDAMPVDLAKNGELFLAEGLEEQQQEEQHRPQQAAGSPAVAATLGWQFPLRLDGTEEVTEQQLLDLLPTFHSVHAEECQQCAASLSAAAAGHQEVKLQLEAQRAAFGKLLSGNVQELLQPGVTYYLVPNDWLAALRVHLSVATARKPSSTALLPAPPPLPEAIRALLCTCHPDAPGLVVPPPVIVNRRGRFSQSDPQTDALRIVTQQDWLQLMLHHSHLQADSIAADTLQAAMQTASATADAAGRRESKGRGRASKHSQEQQQQRQQEQEQCDVLQQMLASMADVDAGFRGITAVLQLQVQGPANPATADRGEQQAGHQLGSNRQQESHIQQNEGCQRQTQLQQQSGKGPQSQSEQHQGQQQQQVQSVEVQLKQDTERPEAMDVDVVVCSPPPLASSAKQIASVDLTCQSPTALLTQAATTSADCDMQPSSTGMPAAATAARSAVGIDNSSVDGQSLGVDVDADGLLAVTQRKDESRPDTFDSSKLDNAPSRDISGAGQLSSGACLDAGDSDECAGDPPAQFVARAYLVTQPGPCRAFLDARAAEVRAAMLVYADAEVMVELIQEADLSTAFNAAPGVERRSRRARKDRQPVKVSSNDTLVQLKLRVFEVLHIHPRNQKLYARSVLLEGGERTLAQLEVFPGEEIRIVDMNEVSNDDYASIFDAVANGKRREVETGFRDTALVCGPSHAGLSTLAPGQVDVLGAISVGTAESQQQE